MQGPSSSTTMRSSETLISPPSSENSGSTDNEAQSKQPPLAESVFNQNDLLKALELVEKDSLAIADSFTSLFDSLRLALSKATTSSIDHVQCLSDATGRIQESAIEAAARGNRCIISCHRLNEEMKGVDALAMQLKMLKRNVDALDMAANRLLRIN
ncbi:hypothetical protein V2J09_014676 [Rumex salicifolius]